MRWLSSIVVILSVAPTHAQEGEAEKLYRSMEKKILNAKSLALEFDSQMTDGDKKFSVKGTVYLDEDNKSRLELESEIFQLGGKTFIVTNGKEKYAKVGNLVFNDGPFPPKGDVLRAIIARFSAGVAVMEKKIDTADLDKEFPIKNFKLGVKEMIGTRVAQVVQYELHDKKIGNLAQLNVWIDTKSQLPLKRTVTGKEGTKVGDLTETYRTFTVDSKLDAKLFDIPPK